jgi:hypothetical protein
MTSAAERANIFQDAMTYWNQDFSRIAMPSNHSFLTYAKSLTVFAASTPVTF